MTGWELSRPVRRLVIVMTRGGLRRWLELLVVVVTLASAACGSRDQTLEGLTRTSPLTVGSVQLPDVTTGAKTTAFPFRAPPGEILLAYFGYTNCPDVCPTTLADVRDALGRLGSAKASRVELAMTTVDPARDTPEILNAYVGSFLRRFRVLRTQDAMELRTAEDAFGASSSVTTTTDGRIDVTHTGTLYAVTADGTVAVEWPFGTTVDSLTNDLNLLLEDA